MIGMIRMVSLDDAFGRLIRVKLLMRILRGVGLGWDGCFWLAFGWSARMPLRNLTREY